MSRVRMLHFLKDWWEFIQIHQYYTMALNVELVPRTLLFIIITCHLKLQWAYFFSRTPWHFANTNVCHTTFKEDNQNQWFTKCHFKSLCQVCIQKYVTKSTKKFYFIWKPNGNFIFRTKIFLCHVIMSWNYIIMDEMIVLTLYGP